jgi:hypothetical protein
MTRISVICAINLELGEIICKSHNPIRRMFPELLRRVASRRRDRCELSLIAAVIALVQQDKSLFAALSAQTKLKLDYVLR